MAANILIRDVPDEIQTWIDTQRQTRRLTQREVVIEALINRVREEPLFDYAARKALAFTPQYASLPFTFIDLFAGIGGLRIGAERVGGRCKFSSEWDPHCQKTYAAWFGESPAGDINKIDPAAIPSHDLLIAGFPCQPFSIAGVSKKNSLGREHGFKDATQGTLFFQVATIIEIKRPPCVLLENVKNLLSHDKGRTWKVIHSTLEELGYTVFHEVIDAIRYVPQHRERVFIAAFDKRVFGERPPFSFPKASGSEGPKLGSILEKNPDPKYTLSDHLWNYLQNYAERHRLKGNGFGFGLVGPEDTTRTLSARYYKDGSEILIRQKGKNPRRLTPREAARLMGFPDDLPIVVSDTQAYRQFSQASVPVLAEKVIRAMCDVLAEFALCNGIIGQRILNGSWSDNNEELPNESGYHDYDFRAGNFYRSKLLESFRSRHKQPELFRKKIAEARKYAKLLRRCHEAYLLMMGEIPFERGPDSLRNIYGLFEPSS